MLRKNTRPHRLPETTRLSFQLPWPAANDAQDAEAIVEAVTRPHMRFVSPKGVGHQDIQRIHRVRERLIEARTALVNQIRGLLLEYGIVILQGIRNVRKAFAASQGERKAKASSPW